METPQLPEPAPAKTTGVVSSLLLTLDTEQCAELLHCSTSTVEELAGKGELPAAKFGRGWLFVTKQILEMLQARCETEAAGRRAAAPNATRAHPMLHTPKTVGRPRKVMKLPDAG